MVDNITQKGRLLSLDVLRGITVAGMILVNNTGTCGYNFAPLRHASWNGLNPADLVFPMFMFIMGIATYISLRKYMSDKKAGLKKIIRRSILLIIIGLLMEIVISFIGQAGSFSLANIRLMGVMQRLGICYGITAVISLYLPHKYFLKVALLILVAYFSILLVGDGFEKSEGNIIGIIDRTILGVNHVYLQGRQFLDPEGILSTFPAVAQVMIGFVCGKSILSQTNHDKQMLFCFTFGTVLLLTAYLFSYACPINKRLWSPTFVLATCAIGCLLLAILINWIDVKQNKTLTFLFEPFGANPLILYIIACILSPILKYFNIPNILFDNVLLPVLGSYLGSFMYGFLLLVFLWLIGQVLFKKRIYIKI